MHLGRRIRYWFIAALWLAMMIGISTRLVYLACHQRGFLLGQSKARVERRAELSARRGRILDRHGNIMAMSKPTYDLWVSPRLFIKNDEGIQALAKIIGVTKKELQARLAQNTTRDFMYVSRNMDKCKYASLQNQPIDGVFATQTYNRFYPSGEAGAQLLGLVNRDEKGIEGIEYMFDEALSGKNGYVRYVINPFGETVETIERVEPEAGKNIKLTIDKSVQYLAYEALKEGVQKVGAKSANALVIDVASGDVIAAANYPSFNPQISDQKKTINRDLVKNKALTALYEPGSTFKPIAMAYAMEQSDCAEDKTIETSPGSYALGEHTIKDIRDFGKISLEEVLIKSSNIAIAKLILDSNRGFDVWLVKQQKVLEKALDGFPGEPRGQMVQKEKRSEFELATLSFGYGLNMTPLQLARIYLMFANEGMHQPVNIIYGKNKAHKKQRMLKLETAVKINRMLHKVTLQKGTATKAAVKDMKVAGKTGTTHVYENGKYDKNRFIASFAGFAPYDNPQYVVVIVVEEPEKKYHYGGQAAAPIFAKIMFNSQFINTGDK